MSRERGRARWMTHEYVREVLRLETLQALAQAKGVCMRPIAYRVTDVRNGTHKIVNVSCGARRETVCGPCARRVRSARQQQCREGWHLDQEPEPLSGQAGRDQECEPQEAAWLGEHRAELLALRDAALAAGNTGEAADWAAALIGHEAEMRWLGVRVGGHAASDSAEETKEREETEPGRAEGQTAAADAGRAGDRVEAAVSETTAGDDGPGRRVRSTSRRQDAPALPRRSVEPGTLGRTFAGRAGRTFRPSMFITLTLPSYGRVRDGAPVDPDRYDYRQAARDALHFGKLIDRFIQNLRRVAGYQVQYFAVVEPQRRLAPHLHIAIRGTIPRAAVRQVVEATYAHVWWPPTDGAVFDGENTPVWMPEAERYMVPTTGEVLPSWQEALDALDDDTDAGPLHVARFGSQLDIQGVLAGSPDADMRVRYLTKYLTKSIRDVAYPETGDEAKGADGAPGSRANSAGRRRAHAWRMLEELRWEPCSPGCANWLRYGVTPKGARAGLVPGQCRGRAHLGVHMGYAGRRVLVSRRWSSRTLGGLMRERRAWVAEALGLGDELGRDADPGRYVWVRLQGRDPEMPSLAKRLMTLLGEHERNRRALEVARAAERDRGDPGGQAGDGEQGAT
ncbi:replication initiator [Nonomuraea sp. NPDC059023]|uniref:replication initiator n=1 Tax=unclassified Nonomuraea TaxID=2593643 RepID=UPI0036C380ED